MKFKSISCPPVSVGIIIPGKKIVVPNQAMSLQEILQRFTRNETLPIGKDVSYHESEDDLEKISHMDIVDKLEFVEAQKETQKVFDRQEKAKLKATNDRIAAEYVSKIERETAEKLEKSRVKP